MIKITQKKYCKLNKIKVNVLENSLGDYVYVTDSAVHQWRFGNNGPSDIDIIKKLANCLEICDYELLLVDRKDDIIMKITERQKDSLE